MVFQIYDSKTSSYVDLTPWVKFQGIDGSRNDVDGPNAGRVIDNALMYRSRVATKYKWNITTIPVTETVAKYIEGLLMPEYIKIRTDYYSTSPQVYECYSNNVTKTYVINKSSEALMKVSFPIVQR